MNKLSFMFLLALVAALTATAQTRGRAGNSGKTSGGAAATKPAAKPAPAPAQKNAVAPTQGAGVGGAATAPNPCGCEDKPLPDVLAIVNGVKITPADLSEQTRAQVAQLQQQVIEARDNELELQINSVLLDAEAKKRGVASTKIIEEEIVAKTPEPTEAEAQAFYDQKKSELQGEYKDFKPQILSFLREQKQQAVAKQFAGRLRASAQVKMLVAKATPPKTLSERARVFATVNGHNITSGDVEDALSPLIFSVQEQVYAVRLRDLDLKINDMLLEAEAQKRKLTARALLEEDVNSKLPVITEADAQKFYNENKARINDDFATVKYQIIEFLQQQVTQKASGDFAAKLRAAAGAQTFLAPPTPPIYEIATDDQPAKGAAAATVTIVEFTDYQCPSCAEQYPILERLLGEMGDRVRLVARDFPLGQHANAFKAAEAAEAAREQGKYWEYTALLFRNQSALEISHLKQYATALGLDRARFDAALDGGKHAEQVRRDMHDGQKLGVNSTPSLFLNGRRVSDRTYEGLKAAIEEALKNPAKK